MWYKKVQDRLKGLKVVQSVQKGHMGVQEVPGDQSALQGGLGRLKGVPEKFKGIQDVF